MEVLKLSVREKEVFEADMPDEWLENGRLAYMNYHCWRNEVVRFKFRCECGGESGFVSIHCKGPGAIYDVKSACGNCKKELSAQVQFFIT